MGFLYIVLELRENRGELPQLIAQEDIRGDLHIHTTNSDRQNSIE